MASSDQGMVAGRWGRTVIADARPMATAGFLAGLVMDDADELRRRPAEAKE
jgi:hypothetical protein